MTDAPASAAAAGRRPWRGWPQLLALVLILGVCGALVAFNARGTGTPEVLPPVAATPTSTAQEKAPLLYIALGDSLSRGVQPTDESGKNGYPRQLQKSLEEQLKPAPTLVEAGCGGATTDSMITGGKACAPDDEIPYANENRSSSQLIWAVDQLQQRAAKPTLVTLTIGGNDFTPCLKPTPREVRSCMTDTLRTAKRNWGTIARRLTAVAGPNTTLAVATSYDPILGYVKVSGGKNAEAPKAFHREVVQRINPAMRTVFRKQGWEIADLAYAMHEKGSIKNGKSRAVAAVCALTWACNKADIHLNDQGYRIAADVFESAVIGGVRTSLGSPAEPPPAEVS